MESSLGQCSYKALIYTQYLLLWPQVSKVGHAEGIYPSNVMKEASFERGFGIMMTLPYTVQYFVCTRNGK